MGRSIANQEQLLQKEGTPGVAAVNAMQRLSAMRLRPGWQGQTEPYKGGSSKVATTGILTDERSLWTVTGTQDFNHLGFPAASRISAPDTITPVGATLARQHLYSLDPDRADTKHTYTAQFGDATKAIQAVYGVFNMLGLTIRRGRLDFSTSFLARRGDPTITLAGANEVQTTTVTGAPTGGSKRYTFEGAQTAPIPWDSNAAAVQAALRLLPTIGSGGVACAGGPHPGTGITVTFQGRLANKNVSLLTAQDSYTGGTAPATVIVETTPGNPTDVPSVPIPSIMWDVWIDDAWADLGSTQYLSLYSGALTLGDKFAPDAPVNSAIVSFESLLEAEEQEYGAEFRVGLNAAAQGLFASFENGTFKYVRMAVTGGEIEPGFDYFCQIDFPILILGRGDVGPTDDSPAVSLPITATVARDPVTGRAFDLTLQNAMTY